MAADPHPSAETSAPESAVRLRGLTKTYAASARQPEKVALHPIDLDIPVGSIFGLLGPNGAGKSTLINILAGLVVKSGGEAWIWGHEIERNARQARRSIGVVPQELNMDPFFTPRELLDLQAGLYGVPRSARITDELLAAVGLSDKADAYARTLSGGMKRRLMVAKAMVHSPPVLVLDEPTAGVDIELRQSLWQHVRQLNRSGTTVMLTTHYLEEAQELCDRIAIIDKGRIAALDTTENLLRSVDAKTLIITPAAPVAALPPALSRRGMELVTPLRLELRYRPSETRIGDVLGALEAAGIGVADVTTVETDLEDVFLQLTGSRAARAA